MNRAYSMVTRAETVRRSGERILASPFERFRADVYDEVTLDQVATNAEVPIQTVFRRSGSTEGERTLP